MSASSQQHFWRWDAGTGLNCYRIRMLITLVLREPACWPPGTCSRTVKLPVRWCSHDTLASPRHACRYAGEPTGSRQAPAQPFADNGSQPQPATAQGAGNGSAMPRPAQTDAASSGSPSLTQPPGDSESQPQPGVDQSSSPGAPPLPGAGTAGSQASTSFVAGAQASDVQVSSAASPALGTASGQFPIRWASVGVVLLGKVCGISAQSTPWAHT